MQNIKKLQDSLLLWYEKHGRKDLIWRNFKRDGSQAYEVYVSEIMLQQTQVSRVLKDFYLPFLARFPNLKELSIASESDVLKQWQGLGYYSRVRNMQKTAIICMQKHGGNLPSSVYELQQLPGIGAYTAGAVACFGFGKSASFADSNIRRVLCRLFGLPHPKNREIENLAKMFLNTKSSFDHNQALLDLGALICTSNPSCILCPFFPTQCAAIKTNPRDFEQRKKIIYKELNIALCIVSLPNGEIGFIRESGKLYAGLYNLPKLDSLGFIKAQYLGSFKHSYTKYKILANVYTSKLDYKNSQKLASLGIVFFPSDNLPPIANLSKKALKLTAL